MKVKTTGRDEFSKHRAIILISIKLFSLLGKKNNYKLLNVCRNLGGKIGLLFRYVFLKNSAKKIGDNVAIKQGVYFFNVENLVVGNNVSFNPMSYIEAAGGVEIGDFVSIAHSCSLVSSDHTWFDDSVPIQYNKSIYGKIKIKDDVWLGCGVRVLKGCIINSRSIVAAGAIVVKDVSSNTIVGGVPAKELNKI
jgi:acetyltransferase-like isoleucine patch superfamily enzyme